MSLVDFSLGDVGSIFKDIREAITGESIKDPQKIAELEFKMNQLEQLARDGQVAINKIDAGSPSIFVAGARPFILWVCGFSVAYSFILAPFLHSIFNVLNLDYPVPSIDVDVLFNLMLAMLGMSGIRTYEKLKGVDTRKISKIKPAIEEIIK